MAGLSAGLLAVGLSLIVAQGASAAAPGPVLQAAPTAVSGCAGTTSSPAGVVNTPTGPFAFPEDSEAEISYGALDAVGLYDNKGAVIVQEDGSLVGNAMRVPLCMVIDRNGTPESAWRFCTDELQGACAGEPGRPMDTNPRLDSDQVDQISYLLHSMPQQTKRDRAQLQIQIWCISENYPAGEVPDSRPDDAGIHGRNYFNTYQFTGAPDGNDESRPLSPDEARCATQDEREQMVSSVVESGTLGVTAPTGGLTVGDVATFVVAQSFYGQAQFSVTGGTVVGCGDDDPVPSTAAIDADVPLSICVKASVPGQVALSVSGQYLTPDSLSWLNANEECQIYADFAAGHPVALNAAASVTFDKLGVPTTTPASSITPDSGADGTSTTPETDLAATGAAGQQLLAVALALLALGMALLVAGRFGRRRPAHR